MFLSGVHYIIIIIIITRNTRLLSSRTQIKRLALKVKLLNFYAIVFLAILQSQLKSEKPVLRFLFAISLDKI